LILKNGSHEDAAKFSSRSKKDKKIMTKLTAKMSASLKKYRDNIKAGGFSMLEAVVVVGVLLALAVGGFIAYGKITENAKKASVESAASSVYTAALAADMDGDAATTSDLVETDYNNSQDAITVDVTGANDTLVVVASNDDDASITATRSSVAPPVTP
jgi:type II secretory pathway pseudopilin PulG